MPEPHRLRRLVRPVYNRLLRERLPRKYAIMGGVATKGVRLLDAQARWPEYKRANIEAIRERVRPGDVVVEVGSGLGVCTVWAARMASAGRVISFEASADMHAIAEDAVAVNSRLLGIGERVDVRHAVVGPAVDVWGASDGVSRLTPAELPDGDVLLMDCEGAEVAILEGLVSDPRTCIVETHPNKGVAVESVVGELESSGYRIEAVRPDDAADPCVSIVVAERPAAPGP